MDVNCHEPRVGIVILTCNQRDLTLDCLRSLYNIDYKNWFVIVVDNGSTDGTAEAIRQEFPEVKLVINSSNLGIAGGRNRGIPEALAGGAKWILILDNDTLVDPHFLTELVKVGESDPRIGGVGPKIYYADQPRVLNHAVGICYRVIFHFRSLGGLDEGQFNEVRDVDWISGCAGLFKREVFEVVGLLDEVFYPDGPEDIDFSLRVKKDGFRLVLAPGAHVYHLQYRRRSRGSGLHHDIIRDSICKMVFLLHKHANPLENITGLSWLAVYSLFYLPIFSRTTKYISVRYYAAVFRGLYEGLKGTCLKTVTSSSLQIHHLEERER